MVAKRALRRGLRLPARALARIPPMLYTLAILVLLPLTARLNIVLPVKTGRSLAPRLVRVLIVSRLTFETLQPESADRRLASKARRLK